MFTNSHSSPSNNYCDISVWTKLNDQLSDWHLLRLERMYIIQQCVIRRIALCIVVWATCQSICIHWVIMSKASLTDAKYTQQCRRISHSLCCSCNFPKHLSWLNYQLWLLSLFTLYPNRFAVFTSKAIILPFIADKKATSMGCGRNKHPCQSLKLREKQRNQRKVC